MFLSVFYTDSSEKIYKLGEIKKSEKYDDFERARPKLKREKNDR